MPRALRLLVGALIALILVGFLAQGIQYVYVHYAKSAESGLLGLLEYLFTPRKPDAIPPAQKGPLSEERIAACAAGQLPDDYFSPVPPLDDLEQPLRRIYSMIFCTMAEVPLSSPDNGQMRVRLLWLPALEPGGSVRIEHSDTGNRAVVIERAESGIRKPRIAHRRERLITMVPDRGGSAGLLLLDPHEL